MTVLVTAQELARALASPTPPLVLDVRWHLTDAGGEAEFLAGHVPGARWIDLERDLAATPGAQGRHPLPDPAVLQTAMRRAGVSAGSRVVACDGGDHMGASRLWWLLADAGVDVVVLDGGFRAWTQAGLPVEAGPAAPGPEGDLVVRGGRLPVVDADGVEAAVRSGRPVVDVRAAERYAGEVEPIDPVAGHIPGAVNRPGTSCFGPDGRYLPAGELRRLFDDLAPAVVMCGSGVTACRTLLGLAAAGRTGDALYAGSWSEWITDPSRPVAVGADPGRLA